MRRIVPFVENGLTRTTRLAGAMPPDREFRARQGNEFREDPEGRFLAAARPALWNTVTLGLMPKKLSVEAG